MRTWLISKLNPLTKKEKKLYKLSKLIKKWEPYYQIYIVENKRRHLFHIVDESPWPILMACSLFMCILGFIMYCHLNKNAGILLGCGAISCIYILINWWRDVIREGTFLGHHTKIVRKMLMKGMQIFILTEVMFFLGFFWGFFHSSLAVNTQFGGMWPPVGFEAPIHKGIALINTGILLSSGASITWAYRSVRRNVRWQARTGFIITIIYACMFLRIQGHEYFNLPFNISDGVLGSIFYMLTGLHCFHVIIGLIFIIVCYLRFEFYQFKKNHHVGLVCAVWYWHFVDLVWVFLFLIIYWWGGWRVEHELLWYLNNFKDIIKIEENSDIEKLMGEWSFCSWEGGLGWGGFIFILPYEIK
jgi:cytochrome c oxidase subunit 3